MHGSMQLLKQPGVFAVEGCMQTALQSHLDVLSQTQHRAIAVIKERIDIV